MQYSLLINGIDSLKATANSINALGENESPEIPYHHMKDAILSINHANEILFKYLLKTVNEHLIYRDLDAYLKAKRQMLAENKNTVMDTKVRLDTVNLFEAIERLELICNLEMPTELVRLLKNLNKHRNKLMHYGIELSEDAVGQLGFIISKAHELTIEYFSEHIDELEDLLEEARNEMTVEDYWSQFEDDAYEAHIDALEDARIEYEMEMAEFVEQSSAEFNS